MSIRIATMGIWLRNYKFAALAFSALSIVGSQAQASDADWGYITAIYSTSNGAVLFNISGNRTALPSCQGTYAPTRFAINASTPNGQTQLSVLMTAYALRKRINIHGLGSCTIWGDTETVDSFLVED